MKQSHNRREFIKSSTAGIISAGMASGMSTASELKSAQDKVRVAVIRNKKAVSDRNVCDEKQVSLMVDRGLAALTGKQKPAEAWAALGVIRKDVVGIKVNCNSSGYTLYTHPERV